MFRQFEMSCGILYDVKAEQRTADFRPILPVKVDNE